MSCSHICELIKLDFYYIRRKLFHAGILKNKYIRLLSISAFVLLEVFLSTLMYFFFQINHSTLYQTSSVLETYVCNVILYTLLAFIVLKQFFRKKDALISITTPFPVTKKELRCSLEIFELIFSVAIVFSLSFSMMLGCLFTNGVEVLIPLVNNIVFTSVTAYLLFEAFYVFLEKMLYLFSLETFATLITSLILTVFLMMVYKTVLPFMFRDMISSISMHKTSIYSFYSYLSEHYGMTVSLMIFMMINIVLFGLIILSEPQEIVYRHYIELKTIHHVTELKTYISAIVRDAHFLDALIMTYFMYAVLSLFVSKFKVYACLLLPIEALSIYSRTDTLRLLQYRFDYKPVKDFFMMIISQYITMTVLCLPLFLIAFQQAFQVIVMLMGGIIMMSSLSVLIPSHKDQPIHHIVSLLLIIMMMFILLLIKLFFKSSYAIALFIIFIGIVIILTIKALQKYFMAYKNGLEY
jgi:hypothetical protein